MKSEKAEAYIDSHAKRAEDRIREASTEIGKIVLSVRQVIRAVEIAEQEAEKRMRQKAIEAFDDMWFSGFEPDYEYHRMNFIKKLNDDEND